MWKASAPIVVGIDGSAAATEAALWAVKEAVSRDVPLRLVYVAPIGNAAPMADEEYRRELEYAESSLRQAAAAVESGCEPVKIETEILWGPVRSTMIAQSHSAAMVCVGSSGVGAVGGRVFGSTALALAEEAYCPVAIVRERTTPPNPGDWIVVAMNDCASGDSVIETAMDEAALRRAPVLALCVPRTDGAVVDRCALDRRIDEWRGRYPDVQVFRVLADVSTDRFVADNRNDTVALAVVGAAGARQLIRMLGPHGHTRSPRAECSVLVVR